MADYKTNRIRELKDSQDDEEKTKGIMLEKTLEDSTWSL